MTQGKLLISGSNDTLSRFLKRTLSGKYDILVVKDDAEALAVLRKLPTQPLAALLCADSADSFETLRTLRIGAETARLPVIVLGKKDDADDEKRALSLGASDYVRVPCDEAVLLLRINGAIEREMARHDALTGTLSRAIFTEQFESAMREDASAQHALLALDIDGFKKLNDLYGHAACDTKLQDISRALHAALRSEDLLCRLGGDEFTVLLRNVPYDAIIEKKARQLCELVRGAGALDMPVTASIGIALYPRDGENFNALYKSASAALQNAKTSGRDGFAFTNSGTDERARTGGKGAGASVKKRVLIVDDNAINQVILRNIFQDDFLIETASDGEMALACLYDYRARISVVLLDLMMPGVDGYDVLDEMRKNVELRSIPVIVVTGQDEREASLRAIRLGAADFITKPVDADLIRLRVESAISKAENERLRAQNSYLLLQSGEEAKYRTVLESTGTVVIEYDLAGEVFAYDPSIARHIAGAYDRRRLWQIFEADAVADIESIRAMRTLVQELCDDALREYDGMMVRLKVPSGDMQWFRMRVFKRMEELRLTSSIIITYVNVNEEVQADERLRFQAERDALTGLYNRATFMEKAAELIAAHEPGHYVIACFDINNFKVINDQYGSEKGDAALKQVADIFHKGFSAAGGLVCRITADNFAVIYPAEFMDSHEIQRIREAASVLDGTLPPVAFSIGRYIASDLSLSVSAMYDRAVLAEATIKGRFDTNIAVYDESMRERLLRNQEIVNQMRGALSDGQFEAWLQPQYNHSTGALIGAEALVRWRHPVRGLIPPNDFIPVFERNGFVYELDKYVWESVCRLLRKWMDAGITPLPISVNVSRYDLLRDDIVKTIVDLPVRYGVPAELLRLEITESAFAKDTSRIISVVKELIAQGFTIEIDDFGSGYSSLNTLKDVPAQIVKLDMRFLENNENSDRGGNILESIVRMVKWLDMSIIAEGVETVAQADYLRSIGCSHVQGYLYAKPMRASEYETLFQAARKETAMPKMETVDNLNNLSFWDLTSMDTLIFNTYVGGACIFEWHDGRIEVLRANEKYAKTIGGEKRTVDDALRLVWEEHMDEAALQATREAIQSAIATGEEVTYEAEYHDLFGEPGGTYLRTTFRLIARAETRCLLYATNTNLTAQRKAESMERAAHERMQAIMDNVVSGISAVVLDGNNVDYLFVNDRFFEIHGYTRAQYIAEVGIIFDIIHPDDRQWMMDAAYKASVPGTTTTLEYRIIRRDGSVAWLRAVIVARMFEGVQSPVQLTVYSDITMQKLADEKLRTSSEQLRFLNDVAGDLLAGTDAAEGVNTVLAKVRDYFGASRCYIIEYQYKEKICKMLCEIFDRESHPGVGCERSIPLSTAWYWLKTFESTDFFRYQDSDERCPERAEEYALYNDIGTRSILAVALRAGGTLTGAMGVDNPTRHLDEYNNLKALGDYMAVILTRRALMARVESDRENLRNLMNDTPGGFVRLCIMPDGTFSVVFANETYCRMRGCTLEDLIHEKCKDEINALHPDDLPAVRQMIADMIASGETRNIQCRMYGAEGYTPVNVFGRATGGTAGETYINMYFAYHSGSTYAQDMRTISQEDVADLREKYEMECNRPLMDEGNLIGRALINLSQHSEVLESFRNDGSVIPVSERAETMGGGKKLTELIPNKDERERYRSLHDAHKLLRRFRIGETEHEIEYRRRLSSGDVIWVRNVLRLMPKPGSGDILLFEYCYSIEKEKMLALLNDSIIRNGFDFIVRINGAKRSYVMLSNPEVAFGMPNASGADINEVTRRMVLENIHPEDREMTLRNSLAEGIKENLQNANLFQFICREIQPDGAIRYKKLTQYYLDRERDILIVTREDVTEIMREEARKNEMLEAALKAANEESRIKERETTEQLRAIMNNVDGGMSAATLTDGVIRYIYVNDEYYTLFGYTKEQFLRELPRGLVDIIHPDDLAMVYASADKSVRMGRERMEFRATKRNGSMAWIRSMSSTCTITGIAEPVHIAVLIDITKEKEAEDNLRMSEEQFRIAASIGGMAIARYDIKTRTYHHHDKLLLDMGFAERVENVPEAFLEASGLASEFSGAYMDFYDAIRRGEKSCSMDCVLHTPDGDRWRRQDATVIFDAAGNPSQAIIVSTDVTELLEKEAVYKKWQQSLRMRPPESYTLFRCNLSKDASFDSMEGSLLDVRFAPNAATFNDRTYEYVQQHVFSEDRDDYIAFLDSDTLLANYFRGVRIKALEYREIRGMDAVRWLRLTVELVEYPSSTDVQAYLMYEDIDGRKREELRTRDMARNDPLTGALNRVAFAQAAESMMADKTRTGVVALMMLDIDGFKLINDTFGHGMGDKVLVDTVHALRGVLRQGDLLGRFGGDEFLICLPNMPNDEAIERKARQICTLLHRALSLEVYTSASIGVAVYPRDGKDYETLYRKMDIALYNVKGHGKNNFAFFDADMESGEESVAPHEHASNVENLVARTKKRRLLIVDDNQTSLLMLTRVFEEEFTVLTASDGGDALICIRRYGTGIAAVLLDLVMPGMDGFAVLEKMRASAEMQTIPVIVVSGMDERETGLRTIRCGAADFVTKPVNIDLLRLRVQSVISKAENERLRAQNSILLMHNSETAKYRTALESVGAAVMEYQPSSETFFYDSSVSLRLLGRFDERSLWEILATDQGLARENIDKIRNITLWAQEAEESAVLHVEVPLKTPAREVRIFRVNAHLQPGTGDFPERVILTFVLLPLHK